MALSRIAAVLALAVACGGCAGTASVLRALAKDPATACVTVMTIYGTAKVFRTAAPNADVMCDPDRMTVKSTAVPPPPKAP